MHTAARSAFTLPLPGCVNMGVCWGWGCIALVYVYEEVSEVPLTQIHLAHIKITFRKTQLVIINPKLRVKWIRR